VPAAQAELTNREIRFTLRFRKAITIAARPVPSSFLPGQAATCRAGRVPADGRISGSFSRHSGLRRVPDTEFASDDAPEARRNEVSDACERSAMMEEILEPDAEAWAIGALRLKRAFRGTNSFRENEGVGEHVRTRSHAGLWPGETAGS
jgi:hypothetical protein